jgi:hypothetical protein
MLLHLAIYQVLLPRGRRRASQRRKRREDTGKAFNKLAAQKTTRRRQWTEADEITDMQPDRPEFDAGSVAGVDIEGPG